MRKRAMFWYRVNFFGPPLFLWAFAMVFYLAIPWASQDNFGAGVLNVVFWFLAIAGSLGMIMAIIHYQGPRYFAYHKETKRLRYFLHHPRHIKWSFIGNLPEHESILEDATRG